MVIGRESFTYVKELIELQNLMEDSDGDGTSDESDGDSNDDDSNDNDSYDNDSITSANQLLPYRVDGEFRILNCPKLKSIQIECSSFSDYNRYPKHVVHWNCPLQRLLQVHLFSSVIKYAFPFRFIVRFIPV